MPSFKQEMGLILNEPDIDMVDAGSKQVLHLWIFVILSWV
jgi:hypothetical protein